MSSTPPLYTALQPIKRGRSPSPPAVKPYYASSARAGPPAAHSYQLAHTSAAQQSHHRSAQLLHTLRFQLVSPPRDLLKEAVSAGLGGLGGLAVTPATAARELYGGMAGLAAASKVLPMYCCSATNRTERRTRTTRGTSPPSDSSWSPATRLRWLPPRCPSCAPRLI